MLGGSGQAPLGAVLCALRFLRVRCARKLLLLRDLSSKRRMFASQAHLGALGICSVHFCGCAAKLAWLGAPPALVTLLALLQRSYFFEYLPFLFRGPTEPLPFSIDGTIVIFFNRLSGLNRAVQVCLCRSCRHPGWAASEAAQRRLPQHQPALRCSASGGHRLPSGRSTCLHELLIHARVAPTCLVCHCAH